MKEFRSFGAFAAHLLKREVATALELHQGLKVVAERIEKTAKEEIGVYQPAVGSFPEWAPLAESTIEDRISKGYSADEPLLRDGTLRDSISHQVEGLEAVVGSTSDIAVYQELGTERIPPRPFIGPAAVRNEKLLAEVVGAVAVAGLAGVRPIHPALGYDFTTQAK